MSVQVERLLRGGLLANVGIVDGLILRDAKSEEKVQTSLFRAGGATVIKGTHWASRVKPSQTPRAFFV
jgi:hypothetical protein